MFADLRDEAAGLGAAMDAVEVANDRGALGPVELGGEAGYEVFEDAERRVGGESDGDKLGERRRQGRRRASIRARTAVSRGVCPLAQL